MNCHTLDVARKRLLDLGGGLEEGRSLGGEAKMGLGGVARGPCPGHGFGRVGARAYVSAGLGGVDG